jgi:hypothetical protein
MERAWYHRAFSKAGARVNRSLLSLVLLALACGSGTTGPTGSGAAQVQFEVPRGGQMPDFFALPYPTDLRLKADGTIDLGGFPAGRRPDVLRGYLEPIERGTRGFGTNGAAYFRFTRAIDPASLPPDVAASTRADASVFLVDIDPSSPRRGTRVPVKLRYYAQGTVYVPERALAVLPLTGFALRGRTRYAAVVTKRVRDAGGAAVAGAPAFESMKGGPTGDADLEKARALYGPALEELERQGVARADVSGLAVFTTQDSTGEMDRVRAFVRASVPEPTARNVACVEETLYVKCTGEYDSPSFQRGTPPYQSEGGDFEFDGSGNPVVQRTETLLFVLTLPKIAPPATGFPIALVAHGTGSSRESHLGARDTGDVLARRGVAAIGIDQPLHGARDDFCPTDPDQRDRCESLWTFNPANIGAARDNFRQGVADNFQLVRMVKRLTIPAATARLSADVKFDPQKLLFFGHSQGGITGALVLALEAELAGGVLSGSGGSLGLGLLFKTAPVDIKGTIELFLDIEGENELDIFHPIMTAVQTFVERADPLNYGSRIAADPPPGTAPKSVLITEGLGDTYTPNQNTEALAVAAQVSPVLPILASVEGLTLLGRQGMTAPVTGNLTLGGKTVTAVLAQYARAPDAATNPSKDGHFVVYWNATAREQYGSFLGSLAETGTATFPAP